MSGDASATPAEPLAAVLWPLEWRLIVATRQTALLWQALLAEDFREHGSSGRVYDRAQTIALLSSRMRSDAGVWQERCLRRLAPQSVLLTYRYISQETPSRSSLRSSIWVRQARRWRIVFHQGTSRS